MAQGLKCVLRPCREPWRGMEALQAGQPHTPPQPLAVPPSIHLLMPLVLSSRAPCASPPNTQPDAGRCPVVSAATSSLCTRREGSDTDWARGCWAQWEPGWTRVRYGQVCPGRAGTARFYHDIQVFPLPALSLAVKTELDHKHLNLKQEKKIKRKQEKGAPTSITAPRSLPFPYTQLLLPLVPPARAHASSNTQENILFCVKG